MTELKQKKTMLNSVRDNIQKTNMSVLITESESSKLEKQIITENLNWAKEKKRLQEELTKITNLVQACQSAQTTPTTAHTTTDSSSTSTSTAPKYSLTFCDFDSNNQCGFVNMGGSANTQFKSGSNTLSSSTGPKMDHTYGNPHGHYMYIDAKNMASSSHTTYTARLQSKEFPPSSGYCVMFWYNVHGKDVRNLNVYAEVGGGLGNPVFSHTGQIDTAWHLAKISLDSEYTAQKFRIVFEATADPYKTYHYSGRKRSYYSYYNTNGNIAIDDIYIYNTSCSSVAKFPADAVSYSAPGSSNPSYYSLHEKPLTWYAAKAACKERGPTSHLVSVNDANEQAFLVNLIKSSKASRLGFYTSGNDEKQENRFEWTDSGLPYQTNYTNWHAGQPNNVGSNQDCLLLEYPDDNWKWGDVRCTDTHPYICEINDSF
ncbi:hypothetical protein FSP39_023592 [Pinctada imbricata]|uniref:C-type lectin domain-containing protein n=1 Tax=Pinctada imbricata TaxID=66713 RepID=A0AA89C5V3_PINIB|nr:hypothetical protein FSP39_023592 [Pinctada imbricata]